MRAEHETDTLIVGAGICGMASAILAAQRGEKVALLEQSPRVAPLLSGFEKDNIHFETGFTFASGLGQNEPLFNMFKQLDIQGLEFLPVREDGYDKYTFADSGFAYEFITGKERLIEQLKTLFPQEKEKLDIFFTRIFQAKQNPSAPQFRVSLEEVLKELFTDERLRAVLALSSFLNGTPPSQLAFGDHVRFLGEMYDSVHRVKGGGKALVGAFVDCLSRHNIEIFTSCLVEKIELADGGRKTLITADGRRFSCKNCIVTAEPWQFLSMFPQEAYSEQERSQIAAMKSTYGMFVVHCRHNGEAETRLCNRYYLPSLNIEQCFDLTATPLFLQVNFSNIQPQTVNLLVPMSLTDSRFHPTCPDYERNKQIRAQRILKGLEDVDPYLAAHLTPVAVSSRFDFTRINHSLGGMFGMMWDMSHTGLISFKTGVEGLYVAGQAVGGPGLRASVSSAFSVNNIIMTTK